MKLIKWHKVLTLVYDTFQEPLDEPVQEGKSASATSPNTSLKKGGKRDKKPKAHLAVFAHRNVQRACTFARNLKNT